MGNKRDARCRLQERVEGSLSQDRELSRRLDREEKRRGWGEGYEGVVSYCQPKVHSGYQHSLPFLYDYGPSSWL